MKTKVKPKQKVDDNDDMEFDTIPLNKMKWWERMLGGFFIGAVLGIFIHTLLALLLKIDIISVNELTFVAITDGFIGSIFWGFFAK